MVVEKESPKIENPEDEIQSLIKQLGDRVRQDFANHPLEVLGIPVPEGFSLEQQHQIATQALMSDLMIGQFFEGGRNISEEILEYNEDKKNDRATPAELPPKPPKRNWLSRFGI